MRYKLGEICDFINGGAWSDKEYVTNGLPVLKVTNCKPKGFVIEDIDYLPISSATKYAKNRLQLRDVVIATVGSHPNLADSAAGRSSIVNSLVQGFYLNQNAVCLRTKDNDILDQGYLGYHTKYRIFQHYIQMRGRGAANQMRIAIGAIKSYEFDFPDIDIQRRIANVLSVYDDLIENNQKQIKLLEEVAQRLYKEWFVDLHFPGYGDVAVVDGVPKGWKKDSVDSRIKLLSGYAFKSSEFNDEGKYKIVTIKNVKDGQFDGDTVSRMVEIPDKMPAHCKLFTGDILLSLTGNVGRVCIIHGEDYLLNQRVAKLKSDIPAFTYCLFRSKNMFDEMNNLANGATQQNLSPIRTGKIPILFPTDGLTQKFEVAVRPIIDKIAVLNNGILTSIQARDRLLPKLMSGELEV